MTAPPLSRPCLCKHRRGTHRMASTTACDVCDCKRYTPNRKYGRCPTCEGEGVTIVHR